MTTITVDRAVLEQAMNALLLPCDRWNRYQLKLVKSAAKALETALYAPATVPEFPANWAQMIHYPECWDTAAYPELRDAIHEALAWSGCSVCKPAHQEQLKPGECWPERIMKQWDEMRDLISKGDKSSLPRDWFESLAEMRLIDAPTTAPAWHDAPTEPGIWLCDEGGPDCYTWTAHNIVLLNDPALKDDECRWYGPIPQDGVKAQGGAA